MNTAQEDVALILLRREYEEIKLRNPNFSMRAYAKRLGVSSGALSELISGRRSLTLKQRLKMVDRLQLTPEERERFVSAEVAEHFQPQDANYHLLSDDQFRMIADWWHFAMLNLINTTGFVGKLSWLTMRLDLPEEMVKEGWQRLLRLGYIIKDSSGKIRRKTPRFTTAGEVVSMSLRKAHIQDLALIEKALMDLPIELRTTSSVTAPIKIKDIAKAKKLIEEFQDRFMDIVESKEGDEVYRLTVSFFPLTTSGSQK